MSQPSTTPVDTDDLLRELEESIPQGQTLSTRHEAAAELDPFEELQLMVDDAMRSVHAEQQHVSDLKARKRQFVGMSKEEVDFCNSRMAAFEAARIWLPVRNIAVFAKYTCGGCGAQELLFTRWMQEQHGRRVKSDKRWTPVKEPTQSLPSVSAYEDRPGSLCIYCAKIQGIETNELIKLGEMLK